MSYEKFIVHIISLLIYIHVAHAECTDSVQPGTLVFIQGCSLKGMKIMSDDKYAGIYTSQPVLFYSRQTATCNLGREVYGDSKAATCSRKIEYYYDNSKKRTREKVQLVSK
jgi:hypothetical protein